MTTIFQNLINQCDHIDSLEDTTIFSISGTTSQAMELLEEIENILETINYSITYIEDDSEGLFEEDHQAYTVSTNLPSIKLHQLITSDEQPTKEKK